MLNNFVDICNSYVMDTVEVGHTKFVGGTVDIKISYNAPRDTELDKILFDIIDKLDHSLISTDPDAGEVCQRYHCIPVSIDLCSDIYLVINNILNQKKIDKNTIHEKVSELTIDISNSKIGSVFNIKV